MTTLAEYLVSLDACDEARKWVGNRSARRAWAECENPSWMLKALAEQINQLGDDTHRLVVRLAVACANTAKKHRSKTDTASALACKAALAWVQRPTEENRAAAWAAGDAAGAARDAAWAAAGAAAGDAAWAARDAAWAAAGDAARDARAAWAAGAAAWDAAWAAARDARDAAGAAARKQAYLRMCRLIRKAVPSFDKYWRAIVRAAK